MGRPAIRVRRANSSIADRMWRSGIGTTQCVPRSVSGRFLGVIADDDGFLYFVGRTDDMIKTSGYRVSPTEIEEVAYATGLVRDAVALGLEDATLGQRVLLVVAPVAVGFDTGALLDEMKSRLPLYMVPSSVVVRDAIPRSPNGKFDRALLREELAT
jgi:acyl-CoA synthetase (AMP-forming)/AMP-acid ligase II